MKKRETNSQRLYRLGREAAQDAIDKASCPRWPGEYDCMSCRRYRYGTCKGRLR